MGIFNFRRRQPIHPADEVVLAAEQYRQGVYSRLPSDRAQRITRDPNFIALEQALDACYDGNERGSVTSP